MVIKSLSLHAGRNVNSLFKYLLRYTDRTQEKNAQKETGAKLIHTHGTRARTIQGLTKVFSEREALRIYKRANNVTAFHSIISFSPKDTPYISDTLLKETAKQFCRELGNDIVTAIFHHSDTEAQHLHAVISPVRDSGLSSRQNFQEFRKLKESMQSWQRTHYSKELKHSIVQHGKKRLIKSITNKKEKAHHTLDEIYTKAQSVSHFAQLLESSQLKPYYRNGILTGIVDGKKKLRLSRLGVDIQTLEKNIKTKRTYEQKSEQELAQPKTTGLNTSDMQDIDNTQNNNIEENDTLKGEETMQELDDIRSQSQDMELDDDLER